MARVLKQPGKRLEELLIERLCDGLDEPPDVEPRAYNPYADYQGKPVEFCRDVLSAEFTPDVEQMLIDAQETESVLARSANGTGKTFAAACFIVYWFCVYDDAQVYTLAAPPEDNLRLLLWGEIGGLVERNPELFTRFRVSLPGLSISRSRRSFIVGLAIPQSADIPTLKSRFSGKHAPHLLFVADEGDGVPAAIYEAIESCMSGGVARLVILFNPRSDTGPVAQMERNGQGKVVVLRALEHPNVVTGRDLIPGAVSRQMTVRRIHEWTVPLAIGDRPDRDCFEVPAFLVGAVAQKRDGTPYPPLKGGWRRIISPEFSYMVLGEYPTQAENQLISNTWIDAAFSRSELWQMQRGTMPPPGIRPVASLDVAELGDDANVLTLFYGSYVPPQIEWSGIDVEETGNKAADIYFSNTCEWINVDATGVGAGAWARLKNRKCKAYRIMVSSTQALKGTEEDLLADPDLEGFDRIRSQMLWDLREWLRTDPAAMLPSSDELREELVAPTYHKNQKGQISVCSTDTIKAKIRRSPDHLMSLGLRFAKQPRELSGKLETNNYAYGVTKRPRIRVGLGM